MYLCLYYNGTKFTNGLSRKVPAIKAASLFHIKEG